MVLLFCSLLHNTLCTKMYSFDLFHISLSAELSTTRACHPKYLINDLLALLSIPNQIKDISNDTRIAIGDHE